MVELSLPYKSTKVSIFPVIHTLHKINLSVLLFLWIYILLLFRAILSGLALREGLYSHARVYTENTYIRIDSTDIIMSLIEY